MLKEILSKLLRKIADDIDADVLQSDDCEISEAITQLSKFNSDRPLSKVQACKYMKLSRSTFDTYIRNGWIPKGTKVLGYKELGWNRNELDIAKENIDKVLNPRH